MIMRFRYYLNSSVVTYAATARICSCVSSSPSGGMLPRPSLTVEMTTRGIGHHVERRAAAVAAPAVLAVTHHASLLKHVAPAAAAAGTAATAGPPQAPAGRRADPGVARGSRRQRAVETEQPDAVAARGADQRAAGREASTYCLPLCSNVLTGACMPAPVWNSQSCLPVAESSAVRRPSLRPTNSSPPPVASVPL